MAVGSQWQTTLTNTWLSNFAAGTSANSNLLGVVNNQLKITGIKLEASSSCTPLTVNSFDDDLEEVLRYYWTSFNYQSVTAGIAIPIFAPSNGVWRADFVFPQRMCKAPTITPYSQDTQVSGLITNLSLGAEIIPPGTPPTIKAFPKGLDDQETCTIATTGTIGGNTGQTGSTSNSSDIITALTSTTGIAVGSPIAGVNIPAGAVIRRIQSGTAITISALCTGNGTNIALTIGTTDVTAIPDTSKLKPGMPVSGPGVQAGTTIATIVSGTEILLSLGATPGTAVALTFSQVNKGDFLAAFITADARLS
jgi:hypothetical protein